MELYVNFCDSFQLFSHIKLSSYFKPDLSLKKFTDDATVKRERKSKLSAILRTTQMRKNAMQVDAVREVLVLLYTKHDL